jgi:hypothetical protein
MYLAALASAAQFSFVVVLPGAAHRHQPGRLEFHPRLRQRMLDGLVLADRAVEDDALVGVLDSPLQRRLAQADSLGGDQDALGVHAVQDVLEATALLADAVFDRDLQPSMNSWLESTPCGPSSRSRAPRRLRSRSV